MPLVDFVIRKVTACEVSQLNVGLTTKSLIDVAVGKSVLFLQENSSKTANKKYNDFFILT